MLGFIFIPFVLFLTVIHFVLFCLCKILKLRKKEKIIWLQLTALDRYANSLLKGSPNETISSRMGRLIQKDKCKLCKLTCKILDIFDKDHCKKAIGT